MIAEIILTRIAASSGKNAYEQRNSHEVGLIARSFKLQMAEALNLSTRTIELIGKEFMRKIGAKKPVGITAFQAFVC